MLPCHTGGGGKKVAGVLRWTKKVSRCVIGKKQEKEIGKKKRELIREKKREEEERKNK